MTSLFRHSFNISSVYTAILRFFRFHGRHLDFRQNGTVDFVGDGTIEKPTPENIGVDTKITFLSGRIAEIEGGGYAKFGMARAGFGVGRCSTLLGILENLVVAAGIAPLSCLRPKL